MTNSSTPSSHLGSTTRSDLWFADGNIVIQVAHPDKTQERLYKLHRGVLGYHSAIFKDLFEVASSSKSQTFEGLPLCDLHDDPADLDYFLRALYDPLSYVCHDKHESSSLQKLGPLLRLSTKYGVDDWRKRIVAFFEAEWPTTLKGWDALEFEIDELVKSQGLTGDAIDERFPEPAFAIRLGRECDIPSILPAAFYHLSRIHRTKVEGPYHFINRKANRSLLTAEDFDALLAGVHNIRHKFVKMLSPGKLGYHWLYPAGSACTGMDSRGRHIPAEGWWGCEERLNDWWTRECTPIVFETQLADPLDDLRKLQKKVGLVTDGVICSGCQAHLIIALEKHRETIWSDLRKDFLLSA